MNPHSPSIYGSLLRSTGIYYIAFMAARMSSFVLLPVYTSYLTPGDYGTLELLDLTMYVVTTLVGLRMSDAVLYQCAAPGADRAKVVSTAYLGASLLALALGAAGWWMAPALARLVFTDPRFAGYFQVTFLSFIFALPQEIGFAYLRAEDRAGAYAWISGARLVASASANLILLIGFGWGLTGMLWGAVVSAAVIGAVIAVVCLRASRSFDAGLFVAMLRYGAPLGLGGIGFLIIHYGDRFFLQRYATLAEIGIYSLAYKIGMLITYIQSPFDIYWRAQMFHLVRQPNGEQIYSRVCTYLALCLTWVVVLMAVFGDLVLRLLTPTAYHSAAAYIPWIAAAYVVRTVGSHFRSVFLLEGKTPREAIIVWMGALACLGGYALWIPRYQAWGAVAATGLGFVLMFGVSYWQAQRVRRFPFERRRLAVLTLAAIAVVGIHGSFRWEGLPLQVISGTLFACAYPAILMGAGFFDRGEREAGRALAHRLITWVFGRSRPAL
jgi:O-antigen/teichoic acid export membrane protein